MEQDRSSTRATAEWRAPFWARDPAIRYNGSQQRRNESESSIFAPNGDIEEVISHSSTAIPNSDSDEEDRDMGEDENNEKWTNSEEEFKENTASSSITALSDHEATGENEIDEGWADDEFSTTDSTSEAEEDENLIRCTSNTRTCIQTRMGSNGMSTLERVLIGLMWEEPGTDQKHFHSDHPLSLRSRPSFLIPR